MTVLEVSPWLVGPRVMWGRVSVSQAVRHSLCGLIVTDRIMHSVVLPNLVNIGCCHLPHQGNLLELDLQNPMWRRVKVQDRYEVPR